MAVGIFVTIVGALCSEASASREDATASISGEGFGAVSSGRGSKGAGGSSTGANRSISRHWVSINEWRRQPAPSTLPCHLSIVLLAAHKKQWGFCCFHKNAMKLNSCFEADKSTVSGTGYTAGVVTRVLMGFIPQYAK
ncbi:hypothetical protein BC832DRAFT_52671 [Gaertneriomyces semiglobifer]|nr:hypothetical protein BC832DRAFT_52671 [Gaertneriomyces semiglobifer]